MGSAYRISVRAQTDLDEIWLYVARERPSAADRLMDRFQAAFDLLASQPLIGEVRPEFSLRVRSFQISSYSIFYRTHDPGSSVEIIRILHSARDISEGSPV